VAAGPSRAAGPGGAARSHGVRSDRARPEGGARVKVLVTGGSGHLGANLVRRLLDDGFDVRALVRPASDNRALDGLGVERVAGDVRDPAAVWAAVAGCRQVYHCAAKVSTGRNAEREIFASNVLGTRHVLRAARECGVDRVVVSGSFSAVGHDPARPSDETVPFYPFEPVLPYSWSKVLVEHECLQAAADGLDVVVAISCAIIGPNDFKPSRMGRTLVDFAHGRLRAYVPGGFEFVAARDIVEGHVLAMERGRSGQRYIISTEYLSVDELMGLFETVTGRRRPRVRLPGAVLAGIAEVKTRILDRVRPAAEPRFTPGAVRFLRMQRRADCAKARTELRYRPTTIAEAVREAYDCFVRRGVIAVPPAAGRGAR
jgi:3beta-hydroxysteroid-4beta-carboxylate 3-dehydrogenase (decarboxylating)